MTDYPSPCDKCKDSEHCTRWMRCQPWLTRYRYRQAMINGYAKKVLPDYNERIKEGIHYDDED